MKPNEIRNLDTDEIVTKVSEHREKLLELRIQASVGQMSSTKEIRNIKREIARLLTVANEKAGAA